MNKITQQSLSEIINDFNHEITFNPDQADSYCSRGMLRFCLKDIDGAFDDWSMAIELGCKKTILLIKHLTLHDI
jgi:hypothetical protein